MTRTLYISIRAAIVAGALGALTAMAACSSDTAPAEDGMLARVGSHTLTLADVRKAAPAAMTQADSAAFAEAYINSWITDQLILQVASRHVRNTAEIDRLVEQYRRDLIMWEYRRMAVNADTALALKPTDLHAYYDAHPDEMKLDEPMVRGIYLKLEAGDPALSTVRVLYNSPRQDDIDRLEKVGLKGAVHYDYFRDQWIPAEQIITKIPKDIAMSDLRKGYTVDVEVDGFAYLLSVSDVLPAGATMPFEAAEPRIRETLDALRRTELDAILRQRLRDEALGDGRLQLR